MSNIKEYGVPRGKIVGSFGLDNIDEIILGLFDEKDKIIENVNTENSITFNSFTPYNVTGKTFFHENGLNIMFEEHKDENAKYEDAGKSELFILAGEIVYIITEVDKRINKEYKINQDILSEYKAKLGNVVKIPDELANSTNIFKKLKYLFTRKKIIKNRSNCLLQLEEYMNKLILNDIDYEE